MTRHTIEAAVATVILVILLLVGGASSALAKNDKVTICHAAGLAGTTHFVTLTISENAVYGPGGHFNENGTPQAGHEEDYFGPCNTPTPSPEPSEEPSATPTPSSTATPEPSSTPTPSPSTSSEPSPTSSPSTFSPRPSDSPSPSSPTSRASLPPTDTSAVSSDSGLRWDLGLSLVVFAAALTSASIATARKLRVLVDERRGN